MSGNRALRVAALVAVTTVVVAACGALGWWQWSRASENATTVTPEPAVPLADVLAPASSAAKAIGRQVTVTGTWADVDAILVPGREVNGEEAVLLVRALIVDAAATGTGEPATLPVIVGWRPADEPVGSDAGDGPVTIDGYVRAPEEAVLRADLPADDIDGARWAASISPSVLAQTWPAPLYSAVVASYDGSPSWAPLPPPPPERHLNFRSGAYAIEWWAFGAFAVFIAARWIRDNGREAEPKEQP
jgi:cytochrome oxidase assembly protein ShyY1